MPKVDRNTIHEVMSEDAAIGCKDCRAPLTERDDNEGDGLCWHCREYRKDCFDLFAQDLDFDL